MNEKRINKYRIRGYEGIKSWTKIYLMSWYMYYDLDKDLVDDALVEELCYRFKKFVDDVAIHQLKH